jgi:hypothetical protein
MNSPLDDNLDRDQRAAVMKASTAMNRAGLMFVIMAFGEDSKGAVVSNIHPGQSVALIEQALAGAKRVCATDFIPVNEERVH